MEDFMIQFYDDETDLWVQYTYHVSEKGYCYETLDTSDGVTHYKNKRISEKELISAIEQYYNA